MIFFFPIGHEDRATRSRPWATIGLIAFCCLVFAVTQRAVERDIRADETIAAHMETLKVKVYFEAHQRVAGGDIISALVDPTASNYYELYKKFGDRIQSYWQTFIAGKAVPTDDPAYEAYQVLDLARRDLRERSILWRFGVVPAHLNVGSLISATFLHASLAHLLANMFVLYLVGFALEDVWGKPAFLAFFVIAGAVAAGAHAAMFPASNEPALGASGAIAGLMGAFLLRFHRVKIQFVYYFFLIRLHAGRFALPAIVVLPLWLAQQLLFAVLKGDVAEVAFWAHIGGFGFGVLAAFVLRVVGWDRPSLGETEAAMLLEARSRAPVDLAEVRNLLANGRPAEARDKIDAILAAHPDHVLARRERLRVLVAVGDRVAADLEGRFLIAHFLAAGNVPQAAEVFDSLRDALPQFEPEPRECLALAAHHKHNWQNERAADLYAIAARQPGPAAGTAMMALARLYAGPMRRTGDAIDVYRSLLDRIATSDPLYEIARRELHALISARTGDGRAG